MKLFKLITITIIIVLSIYLLSQYFYPQKEIFLKSYNIKVTNQEGKTIDFKAFKNKNLYIIVFNDLEKTRLHINFDYKIFGLPESGFGNCSYSKNRDKLYLFSDDNNFFYKNGILFFPSILSDINYKFINNSLILNTSDLKSLQNFGEKIIITKLK